MDSLIFLDEQQQNILSTLDNDQSKKNISFKGPSGSGKTILAIKSVNKLIDRYLSHEQSIGKIYVFALAFDVGNNAMKLPKFLENNINKDSPRVVCIFETFSQMLRNLSIKRNEENPSGDIQKLCDVIKSKHAGRGSEFSENI